MKKKKSYSGIVVLFILLFVGGGLLLYPSVANYWNMHHSARVLTDYQSALAAMDEDQLAPLWDDAVQYNQELRHGAVSSLSEQMQVRYNSLLNINNDGIMGQIDIPIINVTLPIYHGCSDPVLQTAVGHIEWSSLPVGGEGTHCVLSGHRGLPSAKLFTNLDVLQPGDTFVLTILNEQLTYEVESIYTVEPDDLTYLQIVDGEDLCTLVTCTPYGINTHRLLVRGHRIENSSNKSISITSDAIQIEPILVAPALAIPLFILLLIWLAISDRRKKYSRGE